MDPQRRKLLDARRELRETRGYLTDLVKVTEHFLAQLDAEMRKPSSEARGRQVAAMSNVLELCKDIAKRYGLKKS